MLELAMPAERGVTAVAAVIGGLGYPNGRAETSPTPTGWHASSLAADGSANQSNATVTFIAVSVGNPASDK